MSGRMPEEAAEFSFLMRGLEARYEKLAEVLTVRDVGLDTFHLEGLHRFGAKVYGLVAEFAATSEVDRHKLISLLFDVQWNAGYYRQVHLRPFTLRFSRLVFGPEAKQQGSITPPRSNPSAAAFEVNAKAINERLRFLGVRGATENKAQAIVSLGWACLRVRTIVESLVGSTAPPMDDIHRVLTASEQLGWWVDETYLWLHPLALRLVEREDRGEGLAHD